MNLTRIIPVVMFLLLAVCGQVTGSRAEAAPSIDDRTQYIVPVVNNTRFRDDNQLLLQALRSTGATVIGTIGDFRPFWKVFVVRIQPSQRDTVLRNINQTGYFAGTRPDYRYTSQQAEPETSSPSRPNDPFFGSQRYLSEMNVPSTWNALSGRNRSVTMVAVLDTCTPASSNRNRDLAGRVSSTGFDAVNNRYYRINGLSNSHAAKVSSLIAGIQNNNFATAGINSHARILPVNIGPSGHIRESSIMRAIETCAKLRIKVLCVSVNPGFPDTSIPNIAGSMQGYVSNYYFGTGADFTGGLAFFAAGNDARANETYTPYGPISVSSISSRGTLSTFSNSGRNTVLSAPGENIYCTDPNGRVVSATGTSYAAANAAGVASLMFSVDPRLSGQRLLNVMTGTGWPYNTPGKPAAKVDAYATFKRLFLN